MIFEKNDRILFIGDSISDFGRTRPVGEGISNNIGGLTTSWHIGFNDGAAPLISQNRGAGQYKRTLQLYWRLLLIDVAIGVIGLVTVSYALPWLAQIFARSEAEFDQNFCDMIISIHRWEML